MSYVKSVQQSFCDLFTYRFRYIYDFILFLISGIDFLNKRFIVVSDSCWSATTDASNTSNAWNVNFNNGNDNWNDKTNSYYVRCVRPSDNDKKRYYV